MVYEEFLESKAHLTEGDGFNPIWMPDFLFDFQRYMVDFSVRRGRGALFEDCGLGKTPQFLAWAENIVRQTNGRVLILSPIAVSAQTFRQSERFGIGTFNSRGTFPAAAKIILANYEKLHLFNSGDFVGMVCDESSILKSYEGVRRSQITEFMKKMRYRLLCTATAAPNDYIELGTSSEAIGELGYTDMLTRFFKNEQNTIKPMVYRQRGKNFAQLDDKAKWRFKGHAEVPFWRWVCSWARAIRRPSDIGFSDKRFVLPDLIERSHVVSANNLADGFLFALPAVGLTEQRDERRRTITERCEKAAELAAQHESSVVWCHLNDEGDLLEKLVPDCVQVSGADSEEVEEEKLEAFSLGKVKRLVTKSRIAGWGMNWQNCRHTVSFPSHCYDETTEVLTRRGWMSFGLVANGDDIATVNPDTLAFEWQTPTDIIWSPYEGEMVHFGHPQAPRSFDLLVTPNHRMFVQRCPTRFPNSDGSWHIRIALDLANGFRRQEYRVLSCPMGFHGSSLSAVIIPKRECIYEPSRLSSNRSGNRRGLSVNSKKNRRVVSIESIPAEDFMRLAGWYLSEGYCGARGGRLDGQISITQTAVNPEHRNEIIALMKRVGFLTVNHDRKEIRGCSIQLAEFLVRLFGAGSHHKRIPSWVKNLDINLLTVLRDTMLKGDGCSPERNAPERCYRTVSKQLADDFQELCLKTGWRGSISSSYVREFQCFDVNIARRNLRPSICVAPRIDIYRGMVGCVSVANGLIIVRRNGIPVVSGNSFEQYYQSVRRFWRFGQTLPVTSEIVTTEGELTVLENLQRKSVAADKMFSALVEHMNESLRVERGTQFSQIEEVPSWL